MKIAGVNFDHFHMGDLLRYTAQEPELSIAGICDSQTERMEGVIRDLGIPRHLTFTDYRRCLEETKPDIVILCPKTAEHALWVERVAPFGTHILMEKPFAASLADADRCIHAMKQTNKTLAINWPLRWVESHVTAQRLIREDTIGDLREVHFYDGNRGPLFHTAGKVEISPDVVDREKQNSWWYKKEHGGGSLRDYLGYGTTLGTWFFDGKEPLEVTCTVDQPSHDSVDEHSITVARYAFGLSKFETRWGTFSDPWTQQPEPPCGFVLVGTKGTISSPDYAKTIRVQTTDSPAGVQIAVDRLEPPFHNPIAYLVHCLRQDLPITGPLSVETSRIGQRMVDAAIRSSEAKCTVAY